MRVQLSKAILAFSISSALGLSAAWAQQQPQAQTQQPAAQSQAQPTPAQKNWKDRQEYDLVASIDKETDPTKKIALLDDWTAKYPITDFKVDRLGRYMDAYKALNQPQKMLDTAQQILTVDASNLQALYWINLLALSMNDMAPAKLDLAQTSANSLLAAADVYFTPEKRPASTPEDAWAKAKTSIQAIAYRTLGWVAMQRKNSEEAEKQFTLALQLNPADGEASAWLGTVILSQQKVERQSDALYEFARAAAYDGQGALDPARRKVMLDYITKTYTKYHGDDSQALQQLLQQAKMAALPAAGFKILSSDEVQAAKDQELKKTNPALALWLDLRTALTASDGNQYFNNPTTGIKGALIPPETQPAFRGTVISQQPLHGPVNKVVLGVADPKVADCTLTFATPLPNRAEPGTAIEFRGLASAYTASPFMLTFETEKKSITGWPAPATPVHHAPVHHKQ